ncbi:MAG: hypothetical protein MR011_03790 [Lachnospiraceae bacterium]|nr:hypothetical protein [Lachnospiraceae bacterium]
MNNSSESLHSVIQKAVKAGVLMLLIISFICVTCDESFAGITGEGIESDPLTGIVQKGDYFKADSFVKNLAEINGAIITLENCFEAKRFEFILDAGDGAFPDGDNKKNGSIYYGELLNDAIGRVTSVQAVPELKDSTFTGWYIRGNHVLKSSAVADGAKSNNRIMEAGLKGDEIASDGVRFLIDTSYTEDIELADVDDSGACIIRAMWRKNKPCEPGDGNEALDKTLTDAAAKLDIWDSDNVCNKSIEYLDSCSDAKAYSARHGTTKYQYGRIMLTAETSNAKDYTWFVKRAGDNGYTMLSEKGETCLLSKLKGIDNGMLVKCRVGVAGKGNEQTEKGNSFIEYETKLTIYSLPKILDTGILIDGNKANIKVSESARSDNNKTEGGV